MWNNYFSKNLKYLRTKNKMRQEDLAKAINKDRSLIGHWENNNREPVMEDVLKISELFNIGLDELILCDLMIQDSIKTNEYDEEIKKISTQNGIEITLGKNAELTADDVIEIQKILFDELNNKK